MKSTLSITLGSTQPFHAFRTIEVPCRLPEALTVYFGAQGGKFGATAYLSGWKVVDIETNESARDVAESSVSNALATIKAALGITGPVPPGSPLPAIAIAYEAECAAYDAAVKAHRELPRAISGDVMYWVDPREGSSQAARMLAKYVEHVVEQAAKVTP